MVSADFAQFFATLNSGNYREILSRWVPDLSTIGYLGASIVFCYYLLRYLDILPSALSQSMWNTVVFLTPSWIVFTLDRGSTTSNAEDRASRQSLKGKELQTAKSEAMQRIFGLDAHSILATLPRARGLSNISHTLLGSNENTPPGLGNWDNSCYQNSVIQGFASLRSLDRFLEKNIRDLGDRDAFSTHTALKDIIDRLNNPTNGGRKLWTPPELKSMSSWQQQDAQEYFSKVVDQVDKEIRQASKGMTGNPGLRFVEFERATRSRSTSPDSEKYETFEGSEELESKEYPPPRHNPLEGLLAQRVGCMRCGWTEGLSLIPFNCLTVPLGRNWEYDIRDCLDEYTALEAIEGVECAKCTLLRMRTQIQELLKQIESDSELKSESDSSPRLTEALKSSAQARLEAVETALEHEDFSENTLGEKCHIPARNRVSSTKSRQAVVARAPKSLVIHVNRSVFDEMTGVLRKNYADVKFPKSLSLDEWCLGSKPGEGSDDEAESWGTDPSESMIPRPGAGAKALNRNYELRAVITHYGRHENGHYICYRKYSAGSFPAPVPQAAIDADGENQNSGHWFRLSDEDVALVSESNVLAQGGVFMLFYEHVEQPSLPVQDSDALATEKESLSEKIDSQEGILLQDLTSSSKPPIYHEPEKAEANVPDREPSTCPSSSAATDSGASSSSSSDVSDTTSTTTADHAQHLNNIFPAPAMKTAIIKNESSSEEGHHHDVRAPLVSAPSMVTTI
ncbi:hypothetical protein AJ80_00698 [Polytolypa hystricis UAMH7299]|uniref:ubiquitinyl hydrolase 1 n=1 Tax=Polytolypa hystricis (strain UAMH7299) TaxID=1447883 RepID=A0A2B7Z378_POLH7|nr:hypothetical protein AJ80_00698 [Polytolypa hystricis UAMH7299]